LPALRDWQDESLSGAINPAPDQPTESGEAPAKPREVAAARKTPPRRVAKKTADKPKPSEPALTADAPLALMPRPAPVKVARKSLSLGAAPQPPVGENCDLRDILASAADGQDEHFDAMRNVLDQTASPTGAVRKAIDELTSLHASFGEEKTES
jgi:type IV secretion system protein VirD4